MSKSVVFEFANFYILLLKYSVSLSVEFLLYFVFQIARQFSFIYPVPEIQFARMKRKEQRKKKRNRINK